MVRGRLITMLAGVAALAVAPVAHAQNGFPDYRQAAADQYPTQPPPATGGSSGRPRPVHHTPGSAHHNGVSPARGGGSTAPVAVPTRPVPPAKGSLPFTGSDLSGLVVLALILISAGLFTGAIARATRRRRRVTA